MPKLIDPDSLNQDTELTFNTTDKTIALVEAGNLSDDGVSIQCIYSFCKEEWKTDATLIKHPFPLNPIDGPSGTQFDLVNGWDWLDATTTGLIRDGGWALKDSGGTSEEEWMNLTSLGSFLAGTDQAYYTQGDADSPVDITLNGEVNQAIKVYGDASHGDFDYRGDFIIFLREEAKTYGQYDLLTEQNISALTYKKYALPLSNASDAIKITHTDGEVAIAPYANIDLTVLDGTGFLAASAKSYAQDEVGQDVAGRWFICTSVGTLDAAGVAAYGNNGGTGTFGAYTGERQIGTDYYAFSKIIEGDFKILTQVYEKVQYLLRQTTDIDEGSASLRGDTADELLWFVGDTLNTKSGVFVDNVPTAYQNSIVFLDQGGTERNYPYAAAGTISFNNPLQGDANGIYRMFFTNDDAGDNAGDDFGTDGAIIVNDNSGTPISGDISAASSIEFDYDYDGNVQRGAASAGNDAPVTLVAIGLDTAQYVLTTGILTRSKSNNFAFVASDELTYEND